MFSALEASPFEMSGLVPIALKVDDIAFALLDGITAEKAPDAAEAMGITAERLKGLGIVDKVIVEPLGGAHRDPAAASASIRAELASQLDMLKKLDSEALLKRRYDRLMSYGL